MCIRDSQQLLNEEQAIFQGHSESSDNVNDDRKLALQVLWDRSMAVLAKSHAAESGPPQQKPKSLLFAREGLYRWTWCRDYSQFRWNHFPHALQNQDAPTSSEPRRTEVHVKPAFSVQAWHAFADFAGITYGGTRYNALGDAAVFVEVSDVVPHFPAMLSVQARSCYWHVQLTNGQEDVVIASLDSWCDLCRAVLGDDAKKFQAVRSWLGTDKFQQSHRQVSRTVWQQGVLDHLEGRIPVTGQTTALPKLIGQQDYEAAGKRMGWKFMGRLGDDNIVSPGCIPGTALQRSAVFSKDLNAVPGTFVLQQDDSDVANGYEIRAYMTLHVEIQRKQPTVMAVRQAMEQLHTDFGEVPTLQQVQDFFPGAHHKIVEVAFHDLLHAMPQEDWTRQHCTVAIEQCVEGVAEAERIFADDAAVQRPTTIRTNAAARIAQLHADELAKSTDDLTHPLPQMHAGRDRRKTTQLSPKERAGLEIAYHRGLRFLIQTYRAEFMAHVRQQVRQLAAQNNEMPETGEDMDLERKCEALELSPLLLQHAKSYKDLFDPAVQDLLWAKLHDLRAQAETYFQKQKTANEPSPFHTDHEAILGAVSALLHSRRKELLLTEPRRRKSSKGPITAEHTHELLATFAIASLVHLTEKWAHVPCTTPEHFEIYGGAATRSVCNMDAQELRSYGKIVFDERQANSIPLVTHICAMCGCLLQAPVRDRLSTRDTGRRGAATQWRGSTCRWSDLPPVLLLFSKQCFARRMPKVFKLHNGKLR